MLRFDKLGPVDRHRLIQNLAELLRENDGDRPRIASVDWNWKRTGISIVSVNRAIRLPDTISVSGRVIVITDEQDSGPKILVERVLSFDGGEIITRGNDAAIQNHEIGFLRRKDDRLLGPAAEGDDGEEDGGVVANFGK